MILYEIVFLKGLFIFSKKQFKFSPTMIIAFKINLIYNIFCDFLSKGRYYYI